MATRSIGAEALRAREGASRLQPLGQIVGWSGGAQLSPIAGVRP